jgi:hypothetical protein
MRSLIKRIYYYFVEELIEVKMNRAALFSLFGSFILNILIFLSSFFKLLN